VSSTPCAENGKRDASGHEPVPSWLGNVRSALLPDNVAVAAVIVEVVVVIVEVVEVYVLYEEDPLFGVGVIRFDGVAEDASGDGDAIGQPWAAQFAQRRGSLIYKDKLIAGEILFDEEPMMTREILALGLIQVRCDSVEKR
jgi:hypothetical protein